MKRPPNVMSKLESFDSGFWRDDPDPGEVKEVPRRQEDKTEANKKRMDALRRRQRELKGGGIKIDPDLKKRTRLDKEEDEVKVCSTRVILFYSSQV